MSEFEQLVDDHYQALYRFGLSLARSPDRASDLVQQTFCVWAEKGHQLRDRSRAKTWLFTTLYREFLTQARKARRFSDQEVDEELVGESTGNEDAADRQMDAQRALELLGGLDETFRAPITLFYLQQHSYREIAEILEIPIGTVMSRISRAKSMLRRRMLEGPSSAPKNILKIESQSLRKEHGQG